jgi:hypothetical protein
VPILPFTLVATKGVVALRDTHVPVWRGQFPENQCALGWVQVTQVGGATRPVLPVLTYESEM